MGNGSSGYYSIRPLSTEALSPSSNTLWHTRRGWKGFASLYVHFLHFTFKYVVMQAPSECGRFAVAVRFDADNFSLVFTLNKLNSTFWSQTPYRVLHCERGSEVDANPVYESRLQLRRAVKCFKEFSLSWANTEASSADLCDDKEEKKTKANLATSRINNHEWCNE